MRFLYVALAFYPNANATQIVLTIDFDFSSYFVKVGVLFIDSILSQNVIVI